MTLQEKQEKVQRAMNASLSGLAEDPWLARRILAQEKGEQPVKKKLSVSMLVLIATLVLSLSVALATGLGVFGTLSEEQNADIRLSALEEAATPLPAVTPASKSITVDISQAYYEGSRVFVSYRVTGDWYSVQLHEGAPETDYAWTDVRERHICAENQSNDHPEGQRAIDFLDGKGQRWVEISASSLSDGLYLADGTYLDIIGGESSIQEDGSLIGWKECKIPEEYLAEELTFKAVLTCGRTVQFQDGDTFRSVYERGDRKEYAFTLRRDDRCTYLKGASTQADYHAEAVLASGQIDVTGDVRLTCPEAWAQTWASWESSEADMITNWNLYQNGDLVGASGVQEIVVADEQTLVFTLLYPAVPDAGNLALVPVYSLSGEHPEEALAVSSITE